MKSKGILIVILFVFFVNNSFSQTFRDIRANLTGLAESSCGWIDMDRDGDLDIIVAGDYYYNTKINIKTQAYSNQRNDMFNAVARNIPNFYRGDFAFADYNLDGINDIAIVGETSAGKMFANVYKGLVNGNFVLTSISIEAVRDGSVDWADFNNDGAPDLLVTGESAYGPVSLVYRNKKDGSFDVFDAGLIGVKRGAGKWFDYNLDGYPDILLTGMAKSDAPFTCLYKNTEIGFVSVQNNFEQLKNSNIAFGDADNDGDLDVLLLGESTTCRKATRLYRNDRSILRLVDNVSFVDVSSGFADWGDMDHDGDMDLLISGEGTGGAVSKVYRNDRRQGFVDVQEADIVPLYMSDGEWGDYDLDGDLDIVISGLSFDNKPYTRVYRNDGIIIQEVTESNCDDEDIFFNKTVVPERAKPIYYYVYSSTYSDLYKTGTKNYFVFFSPIKRPNVQYEMEEKFNDLVVETYPAWPLVDQGNIITIGFKTLKEAQDSRTEMMRQYSGKGFKVIEVNW